MTGFEPAAPTTLKWCANRAAPHPELFKEAKAKISYPDQKWKYHTTMKSGFHILYMWSNISDGWIFHLLISKNQSWEL